jgi:endoglucanase
MMLRYLVASACVVLALAGAVTTAADMPLPLKVAGNQIVNSKGEPVRLRGVNCASLEWTSDGQGHIVQTVKVAIDEWKVNHIRLPLCQDRWFGKAPEQDPNEGGKAYRALVKEIVDLCASKGVYIMLDLHWSDKGEWGKSIGQHSMPDENSVLFWKDIAPVYANHPAVIFDLYNEPHDVSWDIWLNGGKVMDKPNTRQAGPAGEFEAVGMQRLLDTVRAIGAKNLVVAGGLDWAYDFSGILEGRQLKDPNGNGVLYPNHCYDNKRQLVDTWIANMEKASAKLPIIISEFGGSYYPPGTAPAGRGRRGGFGNSGSPNGPDWLMRVLQAIEDHKWSYTAWDFHPSAGPTLITGWDYTPTPSFGVYVKQMLVDQLPKYTPPAQTETPVQATPTTN